MTALSGSFIARAQTDTDNNLVQAQEPLAGLQLQCGGTMPGVIAIPELHALVAKVQDAQLRLARAVTAYNGEEIITAWVEAAPSGRGDGSCFIGVVNWQAEAVPPDTDATQLARKKEIDQSAAELTARLDSKQCILSVESEARDLADVTARMRQSRGQSWTDLVTLKGNTHKQPLHWRLLDGTECTVEGSDRLWTVSLVPLGQPEPGSRGFDLYLVANRPLVDRRKARKAPEPATMHSIGRDLSPVLRQPIARIIANAETIRSKMAGPLAEEYSNYAADIAAAGQHLMGLIEDLSDLEVVESESFTTAPDEIDVGDVARRAVGILAVRAQEKDIQLVAPGAAKKVPATAEFRRVLQILLNIMTNAIRYSPEGSPVHIAAGPTKFGARVIVSDEGPGLSEEQQAVIFEKFERLGRSGDGGSGLGLYISRRIARAMGGDLTVKSAPGKGARFILDLPAASQSSS